MGFHHSTLKLNLADLNVNVLENGLRGSETLGGKISRVDSGLNAVVLFRLMFLPGHSSQLLLRSDPEALLEDLQ